MGTSPAAEYMNEITDTLPVGIAAVPVYLSEPAPVRERPATSYTTTQHAPPLEGTAVPVLLAGFMPTRTRLLIHNLGASRVWLAPDPSAVTHTSAYPLEPGTTLELSTSENIYAATDGAASGPSALATLAEFSSGS